MVDDESPHPSRHAETIAERLLEMAEAKPKTRAYLVERWARADEWTSVEAISLAWTLDPTTLGKSDLLRTRAELALPEEARHYLELVYRAPVFSLGRNTPSKYIKWAHSTGLAFHQDWHDATGRAAHETLQSRAQAVDHSRAELIRRWARSPFWAPEEGAVLAYGLDPTNSIRHSAAGYDSPSLQAPPDAIHLSKLANRAIEIGALEERSAPIRFMKWAGSVGHQFHADWWDAVAEEMTESEAKAVPPAAPTLELKTKEQETLLKMVAAMGMAYYGWDRDALRNAATAEIASDLQKVGVSLDPDTIRKWLRKGAELIPGPDR